MYIKKETFSKPINDVYRTSIDSARELGWKILEEKPESCEIKARTGATLRSWGEEILIKAYPEPNGTTISVASEATSQLFDWGKSDENEKAFLEELKRKISR